MKRQALSFLALLLLIAAPAQAVTTYSYGGESFGNWVWGPGTVGVYTTADTVSGSFTVADGFLPGDAHNGGRTAIFLGAGYDGVVDWQFTDGHQTLTRANSTATIAFGIIPVDGIHYSGQWEVFLDTPTGAYIHTSQMSGERGDWGFLDANNHGGNASGMIYTRAGTWTAAVPEPLSLVLALAGLSGVGVARWRAGRAGRAPRG